VTLHNLLKIGQLAEHVTDKKQTDKSMVAAARCLEDTRQKSISCEIVSMAGWPKTTRICLPERT